MQTTSVSNSPFSNVQWELLKLFELNVPDEQLIEIKQLLVRYFAEKIDSEMDMLWEKKQWNADVVEQWANGHDRKTQQQ